MKKTNKIAKRILSMLLAMSIVLSFALVSVSALPADYTVVDNKVDTQDFEEDHKMVAAWAAGKVGSIGLSGEQFHGGDKSLKITSASDRLLQLRITPVNAAFEANSKYYMTFWLYQGTSGTGNLSQLATQTLADHNIVAKSYMNKSSLNGWNKVCVHIETGANPNSAFFLGAYSNNAGDAIYIDDLEIAKVASFDGKNNTVPAGASVTSVAYANLEDAATGFTANKTSGVTRGTSTIFAHGGDVSFTLTGDSNVNNTAEAGCYFIPTVLNTNVAGSADDKIKAGKYYMSYYVYSPDKDVTAVAWTNSKKVISANIPQGEWTKVSAVFEYTESTANAVNSRLMDLSIVGLQNTKVYFDDFVFAEISEISTDPVTLTTGNFEYDYDDNTATVPFTSNKGLKSVKKENVVVTPDSATVESVVVTDDGNLAVELSGLVLEETYSLTVTGTDAFGGAVEGVSATFTTPLAATAPMEIATSSIQNDATGVVAPVDAFYFTTPYPVDETTLTVDKFSIAGYGASVTDVDRIDATTVKVSLDGICPAETYTLSVSGVKNTSGGALKDSSITFTTKAGDYNFNLNFDNLQTDEETGNLIKPSQLAQVSAMTLALDEVTFYSGTRSASIAIQDLGYDKIAKMSINHLNVNKTYKITLNISSGWTLAGQRAGQAVIDGEGGFAVVKAATAEATEKAGWTKVETVIKTGTVGGVTLNLWGITTDKIYIDDIQVQEIGTVCNPVITKDGAYVTDITTGETIIELPIKGDASSVMAYVVQYDANDKMLGAVSGTYANGAFSFTLNAQAVKTKIIVMNSTTYAPLCDYIQYN